MFNHGNARAWMAAAIIAGSVFMVGCGGGGGGGTTPPPIESAGPFFSLAEQEPNDAAATANAIAYGATRTGSVVTAGDRDFWSFAATAGEVITVELFATRMDQATWVANLNLPRLTLYDSNGLSRLLEHKYTANPFDGWVNGWDSLQDLDFVAFRIPATGTYYLAVTQDIPAVDGGAYAMLLRRRDFGTLQSESEAAGASGANDTFDAAQAIAPGVLTGFRVDGEADYYSINVAQPGIVYFEVIGHRNGVANGDDEYFDPELFLYDTDGTTSLQSIDNAYYYDSAILYRLPAAGTYYLNVTECCGAGDTPYFLLYGNEPFAPPAESEPNNATGTAGAIAYGESVSGTLTLVDDIEDFYQFTGTAGDMVTLQVFSSSNSSAAGGANVALFLSDGVTLVATGGDDELQTITTILQESGTFIIWAGFAGTTTDYALSLQRLRSAQYETEPNDLIGQAVALDANGRAAGVLGGGDPADVFSFPAQANELVRLALYAKSAGSSNGFSETSGFGSTLNAVMTALDGAGIPLGSVESNSLAYAEGTADGLPTLTLVFVAPTAGTYYVELTNAGSDLRDYYLLERR